MPETTFRNAASLEYLYTVEYNFHERNPCRHNHPLAFYECAIVATVKVSVRSIEIAENLHMHYIVLASLLSSKKPLTNLY